MRGTKSFKYKADRERRQASDVDRVEQMRQLIENVKKALGTKIILHIENILIHKKFRAIARRPDIICHIYHELAKDVVIEKDIPIEIEGGIHGWGSDYDESKQTKKRNDDYIRAGFFPIIINEEWLNRNNINPEIYVLSCLFNQIQLTRSQARIERYE